MNGKNIAEVLLDSMHAVKEQLIVTTSRDLDAAVLLQYVRSYLELHDVMVKYKLIEDEYISIYNYFKLWKVRLKEIVSPGKEIIVQFKTAKVVEIITALENLIYKVRETIEGYKDMDPAMKRDIMSEWNNAIRILMTTSGGIPYDKEPEG